jgi:pteridine reductase
MIQKPLVLITGGVRRLGAVIAAGFAQAGYDLALTSHEDSIPDMLLAQSLSDSKANWHCFKADLSDTKSPDVLMADVIHYFGRTPDVLINNAAIFGQDDWHTMDANTLEAHFRLNLFAPLLLARALVAASQNSGADHRPAIINILDQRIVNPHGDQLSYTLSKQALAASVRSMASAFASDARVNGVAPGLVISTEDYTAALEQRLGAMMPLDALPNAKSVADAALYLASAKDVTGQIIFADAGAHLKSFDRDFMYL